MGQRGRPPVLKDRKTTTVSIEYRQFEFILKKGIDLSKLVRDTIDVLMQSEETPIEQLNREIEELEQVKIEKEVEISRKKALREEYLKEKEKAGEEVKILSELEEKRQKHFKEYEKNVKKRETCKKIWLDHLIEGLNFSTYDEAKAYARDFWIADGLDENTVNTFLKFEQTALN